MNYGTHLQGSVLKHRLARMRLPRDTRERYSMVARLVGNAKTILDVGGIVGELQIFAPNAKVVTVNVEEPADVLFDGSVLPFEDGSFEAVTSLDVIEHISPSQRSRHLNEVLRVSRADVIVTCPLGTPEHIAAERRLASWYVSVVGGEHRFLAEHTANGLPTEDELRELGAQHAGMLASSRLAFAGDFRKSNATFVNAVLARERRSPLSVARYAFDHFAPFDPDSLVDEATPFTNRAFLIAQIGRP